MIILKIAVSLVLFYGFGYLFSLCMEKSDQGNFTLWVGHSMVALMSGLGSIAMIWAPRFMMPEIDWRSVLMFVGGAVYLFVVGVVALAEQVDDECEP